MWLKTFRAQQYLLLAIYVTSALCLWYATPNPYIHYDIHSYGYDAIPCYFTQTGTLTDLNNLNNAPLKPIGYHFIMGILFALFGSAVVWFHITWFGLYATQLKRMLEASTPLVIPSYFNQRGSLFEAIDHYVVGRTPYQWVAVFAWLECAYIIICLIFPVIGISFLWSIEEHKLFSLFLSIVISFSFLTGIDGCCRYLITFEAVLLLAVGLALVQISTFCRAYKKKEYWYGAYH